MIFKFVELNKCSYPIQVKSLKDGIVALRMVFEQFESVDTDYVAHIIDENVKSNGWGIEKYKDGYLFLFICMNPANGFKLGNGSIYAYKRGNNTELVDWPAVEFGEIPRHCFLSYPDVENLILELYKTANPESSNLLRYDKNNWDIISEVSL